MQPLSNIFQPAYFSRIFQPAYLSRICRLPNLLYSSGISRCFRILTIALTITLSVLPVRAYDKQALEDSLTVYANSIARVGRVRISNVNVRGGQAEVETNATLASLPLYPDQQRQIRAIIRHFLLNDARGKVTVRSDGYELADLLPDHLRPLKERRHRYCLPPCEYPLVSAGSRLWEAGSGLDGTHIALYGSHGIYFNQEQERWIFQRARLLTTVEDLYTSSYTLPFLVPMLENAGAVVLYPRERDTQTEEVIVDDADLGRTDGWTTADSCGWGRGQHPLLEGENPFRRGGYKQTEAQARTDSRKTRSLRYTPTLQKSGDYAVYVSYRSLPESEEAVEYQVMHSGMKTVFSVNQRMGGGTWVYLGTFHFSKDDTHGNCVRVVARGKEGRIITSDAVRFGGGMGSVARYRQEDCIGNLPSATEDGTADGTETDSLHAARQAALNLLYQGAARTSGYPRYIEGARYWMQYAGIPDSVYNYTQSKNDYIDDYASRGRWMNWLAGGSAVAPDDPGLGIPVSMGLAFHSDAGLLGGDSIVGTLAIYKDFDDTRDTLYPTGVSRMAARSYTDLIQSQIVNDIRRTAAPEWQRRQLYNSSYAEARNPKMPVLLLELLSHQNPADMRYGLDPRFRFTVSRAIYKGMLRFHHEQYGTPYVVQPLPVERFSIRFEGEDKLQFTWEPRTDSLEATATPDYYILYTRRQDGDWDNGTRCEKNSYSFMPEKDVCYDFRVTACNRGGQSFPSETLSASIGSSPKGRILVVNGFTRVAAPESIETDSQSIGFNPASQSVPYGKEINYIGAQYEFDRSIPWVSDDNGGFGASYTDHSHLYFTGNSFDYPSMHGRVLARAGYSYVSTSAAAVDSIEEGYLLVDLILGKQQTTRRGTVMQTTDYKTFAPALQQALRRYTEHGGRLIVSGAYIASDMRGSKEEKAFVREVLHCRFVTQHASRSGRIEELPPLGEGSFRLQTEPDAEVLHTENTDGIAPAGEGAKAVMRYHDNQVAAAVLYEGESRVLTIAFPMESVKNFEDIYTDCINRLTLEGTSKNSMFLDVPE